MVFIILLEYIVLFVAVLLIVRPVCEFVSLNTSARSLLMLESEVEKIWMRHLKSIFHFFRQKKAPQLRCSKNNG
jgi:hypothetical protein